MINFDAVDFGKFRSKYVISFFWCSVYMLFPPRNSNILRSVQEATTPLHLLCPLRLSLKIYGGRAWEQV